MAFYERLSIPSNDTPSLDAVKPVLSTFSSRSLALPMLRSLSLVGNETCEPIAGILVRNVLFGG